MIADKVLQIAKLHPDKEAIIFNHETITYLELSNRIFQAREQIKSFGLAKGEPFGINLKNSSGFLIYLLASELEHHTSVLLSTKLTARELKYHLVNSGVRYFVTEDENQCEELDTKYIAGNTDYKIYYFENQMKQNVYQEGDFICQMTSGTNGLEKGVIRTSSSVALEIEETYDRLEISSGDTFLTLPPLCHSFGLIAGALLPLCYGCKLVLLKEFMAGRVAKLIKEQNINIMFAVPFMYMILVNSKYSEDDFFRSLKKCISAGAPLSQNVYSMFYELTNNMIIQDYGSTETGVMTLNINPLECIASVGKPVGSRQFKLELKGNQEDGSKEMLYRFYTKSKCDLRRYCYPAEENLRIQDGWICLGDYGYIDKENNLYILGRESPMINVGGMKVDPTEVEKIIMDIPQVEEVLVVGSKSSTYGEIVTAYVVKKEDLTEQEVINYCINKMGIHKVPKRVEFLDKIPRTETGKICRKYLLN